MVITLSDIEIRNIVKDHLLKKLHMEIKESDLKFESRPDFSIGTEWEQAVIQVIVHKSLE